MEAAQAQLTNAEIDLARLTNLWAERLVSAEDLSRDDDDVTASRVARADGFCGQFFSGGSINGEMPVLLISVVALAGDVVVDEPPALISRRLKVRIVPRSMVNIRRCWIPAKEILALLTGPSLSRSFGLALPESFELVETLAPSLPERWLVGKEPGGAGDAAGRAEEEAGLTGAEAGRATEPESSQAQATMAGCSMAHMINGSSLVPL